MGLPVRELPTASVTLDGDVVEFRSLTMREAQAFQSFKGPDGEPDIMAASRFVVSAACGVSEAEAEAWLESTSFGDVQTLVSAVLALSGLAGDEDPKSPGNGAS